eukprot:TRINITY_DN2851_c1_g1_i2.p2 TRINITY_DN2851_c1_g1~~TRINITY_DN2851_c1_g1_i2.p2  ORF type:complete len:103 (-),score=21.29 TRINITY_DN2851_c1_g1_i2:33-314(-)
MLDSGAGNTDLMMFKEGQEKLKNVEFEKQARLLNVSSIMGDSCQAKTVEVDWVQIGQEKFQKLDCLFFPMEIEPVVFGGLGRIGGGLQNKRKN